jgi:hypothetical protein
MTPALRDLQRAFAAHVYGSEPTVLAHIAPGRFTPEQHLQIYHNNVFESLTGALRAIYPVIERLVGEGFFRYAADAYIRRDPPVSGNLHDFGHRFADFLKQFSPAAALPYLSDTARLEWAWHEAFHAADAAPLDPAALAQVPPDKYAELRFRLHPSVRLLASAYPVLRIWQVNQPDCTEDPAVDLAEGGVRIRVGRRQLAVELAPMTTGEQALLRALADQRTFAAACEDALTAQPDLDITATLARQVQDRVLVDFYF